MKIVNPTMDKAKIVLADMIDHAEKEVGRWSRFLAYESGGYGRTSYGPRRLRATLERWRTKREVLKWVVKELGLEIEDADDSK